MLKFYLREEKSFLWLLFLAINIMLDAINNNNYNIITGDSGNLEKASIH